MLAVQCSMMKITLAQLSSGVKNKNSFSFQKDTKTKKNKKSSLGNMYIFYHFFYLTAVSCLDIDCKQLLYYCFSVDPRKTR